MILTNQCSPVPFAPHPPRAQPRLRKIDTAPGNPGMPADAIRGGVRGVLPLPAREHQNESRIVQFRKSNPHLRQNLPSFTFNTCQKINPPSGRFEIGILHAGHRTPLHRAYMLHPTPAKGIANNRVYSGHAIEAFSQITPPSTDQTFRTSLSL